MWGDNSQWAINTQDDFTEMLLVEFAGLKANGKRMTRLHKGSCAASIFIKLKNSIVTKIQNAHKTTHCECVHSRAEGGDDTFDALVTKSGKKGRVPKMVKQATCAVASHGFDGKIGHCVGSPNLATRMPALTPASEVVVPARTTALTSPASISSHSTADGGPPKNKTRN